MERRPIDRFDANSFFTWLRDQSRIPPLRPKNHSKHGKPTNREFSLGPEQPPQHGKPTTQPRAGLEPTHLRNNHFERSQADFPWRHLCARASFIQALAGRARAGTFDANKLFTWLGDQSRIFPLGPRNPSKHGKPTNREFSPGPEEPVKTWKANQSRIFRWDQAIP